jgi:hypothetical protein
MLRVPAVEVHVVRIRVPVRSGLAVGDGFAELDGRIYQVSWVGDRGPMRALDRRVQATEPGGTLPVVDVPLFAIQSVQQLQEGLA